MPLPTLAAATLEREARALLARLDLVRPFSLTVPRVAAAGVAPEVLLAIEETLAASRRELRQRLSRYLAWLGGSPGRAASPEEAQRGLALLKLRFNAGLAQLDIFADALNQRSETENGLWLAGLDVLAADALELPGRPYAPPPVITYLDRGHGAAIRRARTRLPGGGENPVAVIRVPRERMVGSGIASSLVHEVGHQGAALLDLVASLRRMLRREEERRDGPARMAFGLWGRWISEIVADLWSVARLGVGATQGLMGVVTLPRAFVFRIQLDDPHPFPWIRVLLSAAAGRALFPHPQWDRLASLWRSFYPVAGLDAPSLAIIRSLTGSLSEFVERLLGHRPRKLGGKTLAEAFAVSNRQPERLQSLFRKWRGALGPMRRAPPTLAFAVLGQARQDGRLDAARESRRVAALLNHWALRRTVLGTRACVRPDPTPARAV